MSSTIFQNSTFISTDGHYSFRVLMAKQENQKRRTYCWPKEARALVSNYLHRDQGASSTLVVNPNVRALVTSIVTLTGHSRSVCFRFVRQLGVGEKKAHNEWTRVEQQRLLDLIALNPPHEVAKLLHRTPGSVYRMLRRLGASAQMGREWFTAFTLAQALHISAREVQKWIGLGWLRSRLVETGDLTKKIIDADDFAAFCKTHRAEIVGRRLSAERLEFVRTFVFPPSHTGLLQVREGGYKRRSSHNEAEGESSQPEREDQADNAQPGIFPTPSDL
jgi:hypothetical protein